MTAEEYGQNWSDEPLQDHEGKYECIDCGVKVLVWDSETLIHSLEEYRVSDDCDLELVKRVMQS